MFCAKCGKELSATARFCSRCGTPTDNGKIISPTADTILTVESPQAVQKTQTDEKVLTLETAPLLSDGQSASVTAPVVVPATAAVTAPATVPATAAVTAPATVPATAAATAAASCEDLTVRKKRITVTDGKLMVSRSHYQKKGKRFKKKKGEFSVPLSFITGVEIRHTRCVQKIIASFLLFLIFTAGTVISGYFGWQTWGRLNSPYRQEQLEELEDQLEHISTTGRTELRDLETQLQDTIEKYPQMEAQLADCQQKRQQEVLQTVVTDSSFSTYALFSTDFFADAYQQYLEDLLEAFLDDPWIHEWLYPYYAYSIETGRNNYIVDEMYFYAPPGNGTFSAETEDPETLLRDTYNFGLNQHIFYTGRIYITASDFMNRVLNVPDYVANGAVFVKAFGGNPDPADMNVPGWSKNDYSVFWRDAGAFFGSSDPIWMYYGISAEEFDIDWNQLVNEQAYYGAYLKFMNTIAPGLGVFDMVEYSAGDDAFGGMYYDITGKEASVTEIVMLYIEEHPEYLEELNLDLEGIPSSFDLQLAELQTKLDETDAQVKELTDRRDQFEAFLDSEDTLKAERDQLLKNADDYRTELYHNLIIFVGIFSLLLFMAIISLIVFIRLTKKPKHLMILTLKDGPETAFSISFCSRKKLAALQERLPIPPADSHIDSHI